ncbi:hypothetical protein EDB92DRAFT_2107326 [Lactarius akahatsu]|uniref:Uncharacterized protein n=1 Tax=Lactarius akahatsu TaxID=416441 RepID=A0AAD4L4L2_9AGAM|nr:hypothetical protein EDB92DRAFT_2107326 [Lactarius akahatsu]
MTFLTPSFLRTSLDAETVSQPAGRGGRARARFVFALTRSAWCRARMYMPGLAGARPHYDPNAALPLRGLTNHLLHCTSVLLCLIMVYKSSGMQTVRSHYQPENSYPLCPRICSTYKIPALFAQHLAGLVSIIDVVSSSNSGCNTDGFPAIAG